MNRSILFLLLSFFLSGAASGDEPRFVMPPVDKQAAAAARPALVADLLKGTTPPEAARVILGVLEQALKIKEAQPRREARIRAILREAVRARPQAAVAFARALGETLRSAGGELRSAALVSLIQAGLTDAAQAQADTGAEAAAAFGSGFSPPEADAPGGPTTPGAPKKADSKNQTAPPPPPIAVLYDGQQLYD